MSLYILYIMSYSGRYSFFQYEIWRKDMQFCDDVQNIAYQKNISALHNYISMGIFHFYIILLPKMKQKHIFCPYYLDKLMLLYNFAAKKWQKKYLFKAFGPPIFVQ